MAALPTIPEYYEGKTIFLTGATGFIGKILLEKLLRSCPKLKAIYILVRPKKGVSSGERIKSLLDDPIFAKLSHAEPDFKSKVITMDGDVLDPDMGLRQQDILTLQENCNIVIHSAATIRFDEPLKLAVEMNVIAVRKMVILCKSMKKLEVFVHVSTAYANCDRQEIEEVIYPPPITPQKLIDALEWMDDDMAASIKDKLIQGKPNTYTYTKQLAETLLIEEGQGLPLCIVRPSIVTASWKEPIPGWIDNVNGPSGLYIAAGKGVMRSMKADSNTIADFIPVDVCVNMMIAASWHTAVTKPSNVPVFHVTSGSTNPLTWGMMSPVVMDYWKTNPLEDCFRRPNCSITNNSALHDYWVFVSHMIPAYITDVGFRLMGKKPRMVSIYNKLHKAQQTLEWFTVRSWDWTHKNTDKLKQMMSLQDNKEFFVDARGVHWPTYITNYCQGTKKFILKEDESGLPAARAHIIRLRNIRYMFNTVLVVVLWRVLIAKTQLARNSWNLILQLVFKFVRFFRMSSTITK